MKVTRPVFYILFALASSNKDVNGYDIMRITNYFSKHSHFSIGPSTVYPILKKLKKTGWIEEAKHPMELHRKFYTITARGKQILIRELKQLDETINMAYKRGLLP